MSEQIKAGYDDGRVLIFEPSVANEVVVSIGHQDRDGTSDPMFFNGPDLLAAVQRAVDGLRPLDPS